MSLTHNEDTAERITNDRDSARIHAERLADIRTMLVKDYGPALAGIIMGAGQAHPFQFVHDLWLEVVERSKPRSEALEEAVRARVLENRATLEGLVEGIGEGNTQDAIARYGLKQLLEDYSPTRGAELDGAAKPVEGKGRGG